MKQVKIIIALLIATALLYSCNPKEKKSGETTPVEKPKVEKKEMSFSEVSAIIGSEAASKLMSSDPAAKGRPAKAVIVVWFNDMVLTQSGNTYTTTLPANTQWAGVQKLSTFRSLCNWYLPVGTTINCISDSTGTIRSWATDTDYNVHVSNVIN